METDTEIVVRKNINDIYAIKIELGRLYAQLAVTDDAIKAGFEKINAYGFHRLEFSRGRWDRGHAKTNRDADEKEIDQRCWMYLVKIYHLQKYMLCTEYEKMMKQLENYEFPPFDLDNAEAWLGDLKRLVYENVQKLIEDVFSRITEGTYHVGGWNGDTKKRNNNGIDKFFILSTHDIGAIRYWSGRPTITDDLEKACYIIDGKQVPEMTIKETLRREKRIEGRNDYFRIRICDNGNTHYWLEEPIRAKLNFYGARRGVVGENIRIKIFEKR